MDISGLNSPSGNAQLSTKIVQEVATLEDTDPTGLTPPLYEAIDPEALDSLFAPAGRRSRPTGACLTFPFHGYLVTVHGRGSVSVDPLDDTFRGTASG